MTWKREAHYDPKGIFVIDLAFRTKSLPMWERLSSRGGFRLGDREEGSSRSICRRGTAGCEGLLHWQSQGTITSATSRARDSRYGRCEHARFLTRTSEEATGAAAIIIDEASGRNAIIVTPGAANTLSRRGVIKPAIRSRVRCFHDAAGTAPVPLVEHGLKTARELGVPVIPEPPRPRASSTTPSFSCATT